MVGRRGLGWERDERAATVGVHARRGSRRSAGAASGRSSSPRPRMPQGVGTLDRGRTRITPTLPRAGRPTLIGAGERRRRGRGPRARRRRRRFRRDAGRRVRAAHGVRARAAGAGERHRGRGRIDGVPRDLAARTARAAAEGYRLGGWTEPRPRATSSTPTRRPRARMALDVPDGRRARSTRSGGMPPGVREHESQALDGGTRAARRGGRHRRRRGRRATPSSSCRRTAPSPTSTTPSSSPPTAATGSACA